jgi:hypothetical protein
MTIINLTGRERWKLGSARGRNVGYNINFYGKDRTLMHSLAARGLVKPCTKYADEYRAHITDLGNQAMDYLESKKAEEQRLWKTVLDTVEQIKQGKREYSGTSRGIAEYTHHEDGPIDCTCQYKSGNEDGSSTVFQITATLVDGQIVVKTEESIDHADWFWGPGGVRDGDDPQRRVVVDGTHYYLGDDRKQPGEFKGFAGRRWEIEFFDGRRIGTNDLWYQGVVPPKWRERYPDNARFAPQPKPKSLGERLGLAEK